jgi:membrane protein implicated in regulation of membrane protease activity
LLRKEVPVSVNWILIVLGAILVLLEVILGAMSGFDLLLIGTALLAGGILGLVMHSTSIGVAAAGILALGYVFLGRKRIRSRLHRHGVTSNTDALLGRTVRVVETIAPGHPGRVKLEGEEWRAELHHGGDSSLASGRSARVVRIDGVTVFVEPADSATGGASA